MTLRIDFHNDDSFEKRVLEQQQEIITRLTHIKEFIIMAKTDMDAALDKINTATNDIAKDIENLKAMIGTGMSQADVDAVQARLDATVTQLEAIAADTP